ncbi:MAG: hydroxymethylglutaryl-CoA reductase [Bacteroidia bacterium]|nr:hydroxymethylglutaryl-CoA reductase [Bacteroidia bacterium]
MSSAIKRLKKALRLIQERQSIDQLAQRLDSKRPIESIPVIPVEGPYNRSGQERRLGFVQEQTKKDFEKLSEPISDEMISSFKGNIENFIGMTQVPTGVIGPLHVEGIFASGDYYIPMATTEGALVASYNRGAKACTFSGGVTSIFMTEGVQRSPLFKFSSIAEGGKFAIWIAENLEHFKELTNEASRFAQLENLDIRLQGNEVILTFEYATGDAAGQNMVTICTQHICDYILATTPVKPKYWYIEGNYSGDKKANAVAFARVRGKKVTAEVRVPKDIVAKVLKSTPEKIAAYWRSSTVAVIQSGSIGAQGHIANGLAAMFLATGQDVACVSEASVGLTVMEVDENGNLYASVTVPNLIVGTVGGGTNLASQADCLRLMDCHGPGNARKFAEICAATLLAGELSIAAALSAGHFTRAHQLLGRKK